MSILLAAQLAHRRSPLSARRAAAFACALLAVPALVRAQSTYNGSLYSRYGVGELYANASPQALALGGGGTALTSLSYVGFANPAVLANQFLTRVTAGGTLQAIEIRDAFDDRSQRTEGSIGAVEFSFPLRNRRLGVGLQFAPYSRVSYGVRTPGETRIPAPSGLGQDTVRYRVGFEGSGGLQRLGGALGAAVTKKLYVGASAGVVFGVLENGRRTTFQDRDGDVDARYSELNVTASTRLVGFAATVGGLARFDSLGGSDRHLHIGASFTVPTTLSGRRTRTLGESLDRDTLAASAKGEVKLPLGAQVGAAFYASPRVLLVADALYEPWAQYENTIGEAPLDERLSDRVRISGGLEFRPAGAEPFASYARRISYRVGAYVDRGYARPTLSADDLTTVAVTGGFSLPSLFAGTRADLNFEVGQRGRTEGLLVRDRFLRLGLALSIGERWFERSRLR